MSGIAHGITHGIAHGINRDGSRFHQSPPSQRTKIVLAQALNAALPCEKEKSNFRGCPPYQKQLGSNEPTILAQMNQPFWLK